MGSRTALIKFKAHVVIPGSTAITVLSAIHVALIAAMFWVLLGNALVATQVVE